jgi:hypothetical protein
MEKTKLACLTFAALFFFGSLFIPCILFAQSDQLPGVIEEKVADGIPYMSGGIGLGERKDLRQMEKKYNLKLVFALDSGNYLALVDVLIKDASGNKVLDVTSQGPWFYVKLPEGSYTVQVTTMRGKTQSRKVQVPSQGRKEVNFTWARKS